MAREISLETGEYYHIFNRGVAKLPTFLNDGDYKQAILGMSYYQYQKPPMKLARFKALSHEEKTKLITERNIKDLKLVEILSYVFMPNHFHFLLKQIADQGIAKFIGQFSNSYTRYFNIKHTRVGSLFQGTYKAVHVESGEQLIHLSRYIHLNPYVSSLIKKDALNNYQWSSFPDYLQNRGSNLVMSYFKSVNKYKAFVMEHSDYARELEIIKHQTMDLE